MLSFGRLVGKRADRKEPASLSCESCIAYLLNMQCNCRKTDWHALSAFTVRLSEREGGILNISVGRIKKLLC